MIVLVGQGRDAAAAGTTRDGGGSVVTLKEE